MIALLILMVITKFLTCLNQVRLKLWNIKLSTDRFYQDFFVQELQA